MDDQGVTRQIAAHELKAAFTVEDVIARNYQILGRAGAGGMGVCLSCPRPEAGTHRGAQIPAPRSFLQRKGQRERFLKEARIASSLDHPNIGAIYGIDETEDGRTFIVMAFYEGQSLADRIWRLAASEALSNRHSHADGAGSCGGTFPQHRASRH